MNRLFGALGRVVVRHRYLVVVFWVAAIAVSSATLPSLSKEVNNDNSQFLPASAPSSQAAQLAAPILGNPNLDTDIFVVAARPDGLTPADLAALNALGKRFEQVPRVIEVRPLGLSTDGDATRILLRMKVNQADINGQVDLVNDLTQAIAASPRPPGLAIHLAGDVATNVANQKSSNEASSRTQNLSLIFIIILLLFIFRAPLAPLLTLIPAGVALTVSFRLIGGLGASGVRISQITELLLIVLLLGAGTDYGLFLVFRVREEIRVGTEPRPAIVDALVRVGESISASAATVIFALLSLLLASFGIYKDLGIPLAVGVGVMLLAALTLLPALLAIFGKATFWPTLHAGRPSVGWWGRIAARTLVHPARTLLAGTLLLGVLATATLGYHSAGFGGALSAPGGSDAAEGNAILAAHFPSAAENPAALVYRFDRPVWEHPKDLVTAMRSLEDSGAFHRLSGPLDPNGHVLFPAEYARLHGALGPPTRLSAVPPAGSAISPADYNAYRATGQYVSPDGRTALFETAFNAGDQTSTAALNAVPKVRELVTKAGQHAGAADSGVDAIAAAIYDVSSTSNHDLAHIVPIAALAITLLLALVLRSLVAPLYLIVSVVLSYLAALGVATLVFGHGSGLTFVLPFLMFIFLLALGEDYNILVMTRIREEAHRRPLREAVIAAVSRTGTTVTSAGLVLAGTFGVLAVTGGSGPSGKSIQSIGFGLAIGVLMDTFLVRTLLVPSAAALLGRWNWWPSRVEIDQPLERGGQLPD